MRGYDDWKLATPPEYDEAPDRDGGTCSACRGTGTAGGHRCTSHECCGPCEACDGTGLAGLDDPDPDDEAEA